MNKVLICLIIVSISFITGCGKKEITDSYDTEKSLQKPTLSHLSDKTDGNVGEEVVKDEDHVVAFGQDDDSGSEFRLKIVDWGEKEKKIKVEESGDNVVIEAKDGKTFDPIIKNPTKRNAPKLVYDVPECQALNNISKLKRYSWKAKWHYSGAGCTWLTTIALSPDKSIIAIVEKTGSDKGPFGSRIILINTYNWEILQVHEYNKKLISKLCFVPNSNNLVCWCQKQISLKQPYKLLLINCKSGEVLQTNRYVNAPLADMIVNGDGTLLCLKSNDIPESLKTETVSKRKNHFFYIFDIENFVGTPRKLMTKNRIGVFALSENKSSIGLAGDKSIEVYEANNCRPIYSEQLKGGVTVSKLIFTFNQKSLAFITTDKRLFSLKNKVFREISDQVDNILEYNVEHKEIVTEKRGNEEITFYNAFDLMQTRLFSATNLRPKTLGNAMLFTYLPHNKLFLVVDNDGNLSLFKPALRRWSKYLLLEPKK